MLPGLQECRAYARSVICGVPPRNIVCVRVCICVVAGALGRAERRRTRKASSLDCSCGVAKEAEPSETDEAHVTSPNWSRLPRRTHPPTRLGLGLLSRKEALSLLTRVVD